MLPTVTLDASGLMCPLPILKAKKALAGIASGERLLIITTDPGALRDFKAFTRATGHTLVSQVEHPGRAEHVLQKR